jgi:uncharacterized protein YegJ (DUF2314 family)
MGKYQKGDRVKFEVSGERSGESEWMWLFVDRSDDEREIVFGRLDSEQIETTAIASGQELAISYEKVRDHHRLADRGEI